MIELVAKRYVKALLQGQDAKGIATVSKELNEITSAYSNEKFISIITSSEVSSSDKVNLILSFISRCSKTTKNLVNLLATNKRLDIIPVITTELDKEVAVLNNSYEGVVYTNKKLTVKFVSSMEKNFSEKFGVKLKLTQNVCEYNGIKVGIEGLGVEIGFSKDRLKSQMIDHILKAV
jgi:F-type H+-transporting ATPase subunit delta